jgi:hypothetical protein
VWELVDQLQSIPEPQREPAFRALFDQREENSADFVLY